MVTQSDFQNDADGRGVAATSVRSTQASTGVKATEVGAPHSPASATSPATRVSIVVPAYNCAATIERLLRSLFLQTYPTDAYDIIVVDDGSTDEAAAIAERLLAEWNGVGRVLRKPNGGPASARNAGWRASTADVIAFIDADCAAAPDWLTSITATLDVAPLTERAQEPVAGVGGPLRNVAPPSWVSDYLTACDFYRQRGRNGQADYLLTANAAFRRDALLSVGGFIERPGVWAEDADLSFRLKREGYQLLLAPSGAVTHFGSPGTVASLHRELYRYGFGAATLSRSWRIGRTPLTEFIRHGGAAALALPLALRLRRRVGWSRALIFTPLLAVEHLSFCWGIIGAAWAARRTSV